MNPSISVVIRTFNSARTLRLVLGRLPVLPGDEIIIVDSGSTDATVMIAAEYHPRILQVPPPFSYSKSLNLGFGAAKNPWVLVISSHCLPLAGNLVEVFRRAIPEFSEQVVVAYGVCSLVERQTVAIAPTLFADKHSTPQQRQQVWGGNGLALYRRSQWEKLAFDETLSTAEDLAWFLRALENGGTAARVSAARALYRNQGSLRRMFGKGWAETLMAIELSGTPAMNFLDFCINLGSLLKKWGMAQIPTTVWLGQNAHALGAYLAPKFSGQRSDRTPIDKI